MELKQKPSALACYICGREQLLSQLGSEHAVFRSTCAHVRPSSSKSRPQKKRRIEECVSVRLCSACGAQLFEGYLGWQPAESSSVQVGISSYNEQALQIHKYQVLPACKFCGRTFNEESLKVHVNVCGKKVHIEDPSKTYEGEPKKPRTLVCCVCGREFGLLSLKIHYPQCVEKFDNEQAKRPKEERRKAPRFTQREISLFETKTDWTAEEIEEFNGKASALFKDKAMVHCSTCGRSFMPEPYQKHLRNCKQNSKEIKQTKPEPQTEVKKPKVLVCFICGREFGLASLKIHQKICKEKFVNNEKLKQKAQRRPVPALPGDVAAQFALEEAQSWKVQTIQQFNRICNEIYRNQAMIECSLCKRKFIQEAYDKHLRNCEKNHEKSASQPKTEQNFIKPKLNEPKKDIIDIKKEASAEDINNNIEKQANFMPKQMPKRPQKDPMKQIKVQNIIPETAQQLQQTIVFEPLKQPKPKNPTEEIISSKESLHQIPQEPIKQDTKPQVTKSPRKNQEVIKNDSVLSQSLELHPCQRCGRKFLSDRLQKHQAVCKNAKNTLEMRNKPKLKTKQEAQHRESDFAQKKEELPESHSKLVPCSKCGRKFLENRLSKHEECCKGKPIATIDEKKQENIGRKENDKAKNLLAQERIKHPQIVSQPKQQEPIPSAKVNSEDYESLVLKPCSKCDRKFALDRLQVHENICKGKPKAKVDPPQKSKAMQVIKKTKQNFYKMVQDIKGKKIKDEQVDRQLEDELKTITAAQPVKSMRKQIIARDRNVESTSKELDPASISKWNKANNKKSIDKDGKRQKIESYLPKI